MDDDTLYGQTEIFSDQIEARIDLVSTELEDLKTLKSYRCDTWYRTDTIDANWAQEYADEIGAIKSELDWPYNHIDWEAAANDLKQDMVQITFGEDTYFGK